MAIRRRRLGRTRRHRRNRLIRRVGLVLVCAALATLSASIILQYVSPSLFHASLGVEPDRQSAEASRDHVVALQQAVLHEIENRPVYKYSVVPGGVRSVAELKRAAERDPVVAAHYAGFDYDHARVVRLVLARTAYVSYRIGNKVYWTRHRISLKAGETVITDGKITARSRCANRVEDVPQQATSASEPPAAKFEEPTHPSTGTAMAAPPVAFESSLNNRPPIPGLGPAPPLGLYDPFNPGNVVPIDPPQLPRVCGIVAKKPTSIAASGKGKKKTGDPCSSGGGGMEAPEPGTWLLLASGLTLILWKARHRLVKI